MAQVILDRQELAKKLEVLKAQGKRVVLAHGCFDLLTVGHVRYLREAKALGDVLVLALNSDGSVKRLKGEGRPLLPLEDRLGILSAFEMVDLVTSFDDESLVPLLSDLKPRILVKGRDGIRESVSETAALASYGGQEVPGGDPSGRSSDNLIQEILRKYAPAQGK